MPNLKAILSLGGDSHKAVLKATGFKPSAVKFAHGAEHQLPNGVTLLNSFHVSRLNTNTGRLTEKMFTTIITRAAQLLRG